MQATARVWGVSVGLWENAVHSPECLPWGLFSQASGRSGGQCWGAVLRMLCAAGASSSPGYSASESVPGAAPGEVAQHGAPGCCPCPSPAVAFATICRVKHQIQDPLCAFSVNQSFLENEQEEVA